MTTNRKCISKSASQSGLRRISSPAHCRYCDGEAYMWRERVVKLIVFRGVAPVYKPGNLATGQYPQADFGSVEPDKATVYCEYSVFPDYEKFTNDSMARYDMLNRWHNQGYAFPRPVCPHPNPLPFAICRYGFHPQWQRCPGCSGNWQESAFSGSRRRLCSWKTDGCGNGASRPSAGAEIGFPHGYLCGNLGLYGRRHLFP
jgi:hypothetical protein